MWKVEQKKTTNGEHIIGFHFARSYYEFCYKGPKVLRSVSIFIHPFMYFKEEYAQTVDKAIRYIADAYSVGSELRIEEDLTKFSNKKLRLFRVSLGSEILDYECRIWESSSVAKKDLWYVESIDNPNKPHSTFDDFYHTCGLFLEHLIMERLIV